MPPVVIGPTVAIIGLSLAGDAINNLNNKNTVATAPPLNIWLSILCGLVALAVVIACSVYGKRTVKLIPFIIGILSGYGFAVVLTVIGGIANVDALKIVDFTPFKMLVSDGVGLSTFFEVPEFTFVKALGAFDKLDASYFVTVLVAYVPVAFVVFAEHIADHKNISSIVEKDLLEDPGLDKTLLGDGVGSMAGAFFGGCPNTTYGESVACVAITGNASVITIFAAAIGAILISFISPFVAFVDSIPPCVMGGVCIGLYGFIAVSGLKMIQKVDLEKHKNLFVVSVILICGIGGLTLTFGKVSITSIACALILGILTNLLVSRAKD